MLKKQEDAEFDAELEAIMLDDTSGKKKKKKLDKKSGNRNQERPKWSKKRKIITIGAACLVVLFILTSMTGGKKVPLQSVITSPMVKSDIEQKLSVNGPVSGTDSVDVVSNLHAEILEILVKEGDKVQKDQLLAVLDDSDIKKEVEIAQNAYNLTLSTLQEKTIEAQNGYAKAAQDYNTAKANYDRTNVLFQAGSAPQVELETARNAMNDAKRMLSTYTIKDGKAVANESYELDVKSKGFALEQKNKDLENTKIKSAIDGTVVRVNSKVGRFADKTEDDVPLFIIENLDVLEMKISISEYSIGKVALGQDVSISADILNGITISGEVVAISPTGEEKGGGSTERVIPITVRIKEQNTNLIAGITAKAEIILEESKDTWVVPISALIQQPDGSTSIAAVDVDVIRLIGVDTGVESDIQVEVIPKEGFTIDETTVIAVNPNSGFTDGMKVIVQSPGK